MTTLQKRTVDLGRPDHPEQVAQVLRWAADSYYEAHNELSSMWSDKNAGKEWAQVAKILEQAASKIERLWE